MSVQIPDVEWHTRCLVCGSTSYAYEEIVNALQDFNMCEQEYRELIEQCGRITNPYTNIPYGIAHASEDVQVLYFHMDSSLMPSINLGSGKERWPVKTWQKQTRAYRQLIKKLRKALETVKVTC